MQKLNEKRSKSWPILLIEIMQVATMQQCRNFLAYRVYFTNIFDSNI